MRNYVYIKLLPHRSVTRQESEKEDPQLKI